MGIGAKKTYPEFFLIKYIDVFVVFQVNYWISTT